MEVIARPRNSGKTTILLHYMMVHPISVMVTYTKDYAKGAFQLSQKLGLDIPEHRFIGMVDVEMIHERCEILVDNADWIIARSAESGYKLIKRASVITITG